jgi:hypothetical protein
LVIPANAEVMDDAMLLDVNVTLEDTLKSPEIIPEQFWKVWLNMLDAGVPDRPDASSVPEGMLVRPEQL